MKTSPRITKKTISRDVLCGEQNDYYICRIVEELYVKKKQKSPNDQRSDSMNPNNPLSDAYFRSLESKVDQRFERVDQRFERLERVFERLEGLGEKFERRFRRSRIGD